MDPFKNMIKDIAIDFRLFDTVIIAYDISISKQLYAVKVFNPEEIVDTIMMIAENAPEQWPESDPELNDYEPCGYRNIFAHELLDEIGVVPTLLKKRALEYLDFFDESYEHPENLELKCEFLAGGY